MIMPPVKLAVQRQPGAPAEDRDLGAEAQELGDSRHHDVEVLPDHLRLQRLHGFISPNLNPLRNHAHGIDDLRIARHRLGLKICAGAVGVGAGERNRGDFLVDQRDNHQAQACSEHDKTELRVDEKHDGKIHRCDRCVEHREQNRSGDERPQMLKICERLELPA